MYYWRDGQHEVDFVLQRGPRLVAIEVKSGPRRGSLSGLETFAERFQPQRLLLVGERGIPLNEFPGGAGRPLVRRGGMNCIVARTCTEVPQNDTRQERDSPSRPLAAFRTVPAYVLLGDPGSGKSTSFEAEREALGEDACLVTARDFLALEPNAHPEWRGKTLFIDGLDEVRAGSADARTPFDELRRRLDSLGRPRFRLSCREAGLARAERPDQLSQSDPGCQPDRAASGPAHGR